MKEPNRNRRNDLLAEQIIKGLASRNMTGYYVQTKEEALEKALSLIPKGSKITNGGSMSIAEIGLTEAVSGPDYEYCNREKTADKRAAEMFAYDADVFLGSTNAITEDGILVNIDGNSNRVSAYAYGPKKLILVVGMNKVAKDVDAAIKRARNEAATINAQRFGLNTPCNKLGRCMDCKSIDTICCQFLITRFERHKDRVHVILVNENLGF
ncbi:MAG: lactate utilization protein [Lachnospiraceae bacterium]|nr:lactate utilization protein [Lachnospiraceae bacterium]